MTHEPTSPKWTPPVSLKREPSEEEKADKAKRRRLQAAHRHASNKSYLERKAKEAANKAADKA